MSTKYNTYYYKLPSFDKNVDGASLVYSQKHGLISICDIENNHNLNILKFYDHEENEWKWNDMKWKWERERCALSAAFINEDKMVCCGGSARYRQYVDVYDFTTKSMTKLSELNEKRTYS